MKLACRTFAVFASVTTLAACSRENAPAPASAGAAVTQDAASTQSPTPTGDAPSREAGEAPDAGDRASTSSASPALPSFPAGGAGAAPQAAAPAAPDGGPPPDAGATPLTAPLSAAVAIVGGQEILIARDGSAIVDPAAAFRIEVAVHLTDGRMALHDEQDAMVASSGTNEIGASWTRYHLVPDGPLRPGTSYAIWIDGAVTRQIHDASGRAYGPVVLKLKTSGERPAAPARKKRGKRRP